MMFRSGMELSLVLELDYVVLCLVSLLVSALLIKTANGLFKKIPVSVYTYS